MAAASDTAGGLYETTPEQPIAIGISSCLLGEAVRFDGNHKHDSWITSELGQFFTFRPVCPEVAIGLGVPREPIRLTGDVNAPRVTGTRDPALDVTDKLENYGRRMATELGPDISGYILKARSPSCGMERVPVYTGERGGVERKGIGAYARTLMASAPLLPVEEEGRLHDPVLRENFIERVFAFRRWQDLIRGGVSRGRLVDFHTAHKLTLMSHGAVQMRELGRLVADLGKRPIREAAEEYGRHFMAALTRRATRRRHTDVLMHLSGYLKRQLDSADRQELREIIEAYRLGHVPLIVPITLLQHHFRRHPDDFVARQVYLQPHPGELRLRNGI